MRGDCQREFAEAATADGIVFVAQSLPWLTQRGHLDLPDEAATAATALAQIFLALGGDLSILATAQPRRLAGDFLHQHSGTLVEVDESQHFTSARLKSLSLYPASVPFGFDLDEYRLLCDDLRSKSDGYFRAKAARGFGVGGRQRQRAYYDSLRDLAAPAMGHPPLIRIAAPDRDGRAAYARHRDRLLTVLR
jgi:hypothetical protein